MTERPGALYKVCGRLHVDSQAVHNLAARHDVVTTADGWRVLDAEGKLEFVRVDQAPLPGQRGALYQMVVEGPVRANLRAMFEGLLVPRGELETWPGQPASSCAHACACAPCREKHGSKP